MVEEVRFMWCDALDEVLQCPVCLETRHGQKVQCSNGHHICVECRGQLYSCPICKIHFLATRNLAVEQITAKFIEIKTSLLDPYHILNRRILKGKVCKETQTENISYISTECQTDNTVPVSPRSSDPENLQTLSPQVAKGKYPCKIGTCSMELPHGRMIGHLRYYHKDVFHEYYKRTVIFKRNIDLKYYPHSEYSFAYHIKGMGLFFLNVYVHQKGNLAINVQIVNSNEIGKQFTYTLETGYGQNTKYNGVVKSCRVRKDQVLSSRDCLYIQNDTMRHMVNRNTGAFICSVFIKRKIYNTEVGDHSMPSTSAES